MKKNDINIVVENQLCTACGSCKVACPVNAILMQKTEIGRLYADINTDTCTHCGICYDICPGYDVKNNVLIEGVSPFEGIVKQTYTGISTNRYIYENSQSGGLVTECLAYLFDTQKIDTAVVCIADYGKERPDVQAVVVRNKEDLLKSQRSSYTPIDMVSVLENIEKQDRIAFVGLPCHIQGVVALQNKFKKYQNIVYKFGLICDRTLSEAITDVFLKIYWKKKIYWRNKTLFHNYKTAPVIIEAENGLQKIIPATMRHTLKDYFTSPRCRICFDKLNIHADIVFGDPWGMSNIDFVNGESLVITRTENGENLIRELITAERVKLNIASFEEVKKGQFIEKRKEQVKVFSEVYKANNWLLPAYWDKLDLQESTKSVFSKSEKLISDFKNLESKSREEIVKSVAKEIKIQTIKSKAKLPFRILKKLVKSIIK
ncbi:MAG: Coenzyme F420 hydrogenase/dehydrogenase, beta subunit C-terminal domain [Paludibacter sp.]|jgi:coenzyme F420 hydrogenase subunit beta|nr:Coenzyme F420 hydrogenase/dehydrogenase, beta subunit C-terminal domain [Paludibacter sp.]